MSRDAYVSAGGNRSPRSVRRVGELPTVDRSPSRSYPVSGGRGSPIGRKGIRSGGGTRSGNNSPDHAGYGYHHQSMGSPYYSRDDELGSPMLEERGRSMTVSSVHHRSRSASRPSMAANPMSVRYQSLDRGGTTFGDPAHEREFMPIRDPRDRSLDRSALSGRDRSLERGLYLEDELYGSRSARQSPHLMGSVREPLLGELQHQNTDLQRELGNLKKELELTNQKLGSSMHSIKTFWSPELKKERALRKEESAKYSLINDQLKLLSSENQVQYYNPLRFFSVHT